ncbi:MAG: HAMP domain-containing histidine kinase [Gammaproteobacteria bacterium]|nr:HAMP domain-containing histidine kinase [Gammaproteobacteria bacterium]MBU1555584.1 HAMP domain-containing histidine kinase [Gammaproteobacteria bacterium]MBU2071731.1 HAMP domain-containing histidine kinase [Gammaproteobacteria bacterium]MBU2182364.1 HAMP domain-containing histidine kinase [Gammaproteobacteria bacterium]MBU2203543.1 HAMP domain-containing histidine kinase [Gammaproteobacteria bacterium]
MAWINKRPASLERHSLVHSIALLLCSLAAALLAGLAFKQWWLWLLLLPAWLVLNKWQFSRRKQMLAAFNRASVQLEAMHNQDYSLQAKAAYQTGIAASFQQQLQQLSCALQQRKSFFDEQQFLLYRLIDQLNTPILVFDHKQQLSYANDEFNGLFGQPWQSLRQTSAQRLGLHSEPHWHFADSERQRQWQIRHSRFMDQGQRHQLLVFINIQAALRDTELEAWQQLIRVLSHEIRNSLTPVLALSEQLQPKLAAQRDQQALEVIRQRSQHLQDFVSRYSELNKPLSINLQPLCAADLFAAIQPLFSGAALQARGLSLQFHSDATLLQQVLINLIKNAIEAGSPPGSIQLQFARQQNQLQISVSDSGHGISNSRDLFVPFYTTKAQGQGIGLQLCRNIVRQLAGELTLQPRSDGQPGCCASISLPWHNS